MDMDVTVEMEEKTVTAEVGTAEKVVGPTPVGLQDAVGDVVVLLVLTKQQHALESLDAEEEHGDAKVGIERARATVYVWQKEEALLG